MRIGRWLITILLAVGCAFCAFGQQRLTRAQYIEKYSALAVEQMISGGIPASITLAQGCLESSDGNSFLAREGNNHFGIKCHSGWKGMTIRHADDRSGECFRKYGSVEESFKDHSDFLRAGDRYADLFKLDRTDYRGWAYGLKKAGYATDQSYAQRLIKIIEDNNLQRFDRLEVSYSRHELLRERGRYYTVAAAGDTYASIAREFNIFKREILVYNGLRGDRPLKAGTRVYLERKKKF